MVSSIAFLRSAALRKAYGFLEECPKSLVEDLVCRLRIDPWPSVPGFLWQVSLRRT